MSSPPAGSETVGGADLARIRQGVFRLLAAGFGRPSLGTTSDVAAGMAALEQMGVGDFAFFPTLSTWVDRLVAADIDLVASEHVRLFGAGVDGAICPPIESQHLGANLHGDPARYASRIEHLMRRAGFSARHDSLPPDHLVVELELTSAFCGAEADARTRGDSGLQWLHSEAELLAVLRAWIGGFAGAVAGRDRSGVLGALATATVACVEHEHDIVQMLIRAEALA